MPTPRFKDLRPEQAVAVLDAFLGRESPATFSEKLAGQSLSVVVKTTGEVATGTKSSTRTARGMFPEVSSVLERFHPPVPEDVRYSFEVLRKSKRPDYIDYKLPSEFVAVDFTGTMDSETADVLNSAQDEVRFYTKSDIDRPVGSMQMSRSQKLKLAAVRDKLAAGTALTSKEKSEAEGILMDLLDSGKIPSVVGGVRIEGLFGRIDGAGFKIPSKMYADVQLKQSGIYAVVKSTSKSEYVKRFEEDPDGTTDRHVRDVTAYLRSLTSEETPSGFRTFFTSDEAEEVLQEPGRQMGTAVYARVKSKEWPSTDPRTVDVKSENKSPVNGHGLLKEYIRTALCLRVR